MKRTLLLVCMSFAMACSKEPTESPSASVIPVQVQVLEEYEPGIAKETVQTASGLTLQKLDSVYILEGDVLLSPEQVKALEQPQTRGAIVNNTWPGGVVYYRFFQRRQPGGPNFTQTRIFYDAIAYYHKVVIRFQFVSLTAFWSEMGRCTLL